MLKPHLYRRFRGFNFILVCQTDAVLLRPLPADETWAFDYLGAPWKPPKLVGWDAKMRRLKGRGSTEKRFLSVGNGGLSLRRTEKFGRKLRFPRFRETPQEDKAISYFAPRLGILVADAGLAEKLFMETGAASWRVGDPHPDVYGYHALGAINPELERILLREPSARSCGPDSRTCSHDNH
jgi:hypothetical protein